MSEAETSEASDFLSETILEEKLLDLWPDHPCLYDVRSATFMDRGKREDTFHDMAMKLNKSGTLLSYCKFRRLTSQTFMS